MAERLLKKKAHKVSPKKTQEEQAKKTVIVGTYKEKQLAWIKRHGVYNYPVKDGDVFDEKAFASIKELWLYADVKGTRHVFEAEFIGIKTRGELVEEYGYPADGVFGRVERVDRADGAGGADGRGKRPACPKSHASRYYVFKTKFLEYGSRLDDPIVIARTADFGGRSAKVKKAIEQFKADGEFAPLTHYLPPDLSQVPSSQLRVCEAAVQMNLFAWNDIQPVHLPKRNGFTAVELFAGAGGLSLGLERAGIHVVIANEIMPDFAATLAANRPDTNVINADMFLEVA